MTYIPPRDTDAEQALLGACIVEEKAVISALRLVREDHFYTTANRDIFCAIRDLYDNGKPIDIVTLTMTLRDHGKLDSIGGPCYLTKIVGEVPTAANVEAYAEAVRQKAILRAAGTGLIESINSIMANRTADEVTSEINNLAHNLNNEILHDHKIDLYHISEALGGIQEEILAADRGLADKTCIKTGYSQIDRMALFLPSYLIYLAGRPSSGKTTFAFNLALKMVALGHPVYFGSYEVSKQFCLVRLLCQAGLIANKKVMFEDGKRIKSELTATCRRLEQYPLYLSHRPLSVEGISRVVEIVRERENKTPIVFIDRFELIDEPYIHQDGSEYNRLSRISQKLRRLKDDYQIPVCCLIQMNREVEKRAAKAPILSDLQGTGATEQGAQVVIFVHRDKELNKTQEAEGKTLTADMVVAKNMNGATGILKFRFAAEIPSFFEMADFEGQSESQTQCAEQYEFSEENYF